MSRSLACFSVGAKCSQLLKVRLGGFFQQPGFTLWTNQRRRCPRSQVTKQEPRGGRASAKKEDRGLI